MKKAAQLVTLSFICLLGVMSFAAYARPFAISVDGSEVTDQKTGLIWRRCAEGMILSHGTCTGSASAFTYEAALQHAVAVSNRSAIAWRLPSVKELLAITDKNTGKLAIDSTVFPGTPANSFWSASPDAGNLVHVWIVNFWGGYVYSRSRLDSYYVRLVRTNR